MVPDVIADPLESMDEPIGGDSIMRKETSIEANEKRKAFAKQVNEYRQSIKQPLKKAPSNHCL